MEDDVCVFISVSNLKYCMLHGIEKQAPLYMRRGAIIQLISFPLEIPIESKNGLHFAATAAWEVVYTLLLGAD
jgi:hypothetical protein